MAPEVPQGYLVVKVLEAAGHNGDDAKVWDDSLKEAFVKSECAHQRSGLKPRTAVLET